jgi:hypothetical protein
MISKVKMVVVAITLFFCGPLIRVHAQQAQAETQAGQVIGFTESKQNTKGKLSVVNGVLRFTHEKGNASIAAASIEDVLTGKDSQRVIGGTVGTLASIAAPFGSGIALPLLRRKVDILTIQYRDGDGGLRGAVFTVPQKDDPIRRVNTTTRIPSFTLREADRTAPEEGGVPTSVS